VYIFITVRGALELGSAACRSGVVVPMDSDSERNLNAARGEAR
jgi:hypothetical protein